MRLPKVRHKIKKSLGKGLYICTDSRATSDSAFEGSSGGAGYDYFGHKNPLIKIEKKNRKILRKGTRTALKTSEPPTRTSENG